MGLLFRARSLFFPPKLKGGGIGFGVIVTCALATLATSLELSFEFQRQPNQLKIEAQGPSASELAQATPPQLHDSESRSGSMKFESEPQSESGPQGSFI